MTEMTFDLIKADDINMTWNGLDFDDDEDKKKEIDWLKEVYSNNFILRENVLENIDDEFEVTVCYPGYGAVFNLAAKSTSLGTFVSNAFKVALVASINS